MPAARVRASACLALVLSLGTTLADAGAPSRAAVTRDADGAVTRGPRDERRLALVFTGHEFAEGMPTILDELRRVGGRASFFLTGDFVRQPAFARLVRRAVADGHYVGPHSDRHLLYSEWLVPKATLVTREVFDRDVTDNLRALTPFGIDPARVRYWVSSYERYNADIVRWAAALGLTTVDFTRGTRANADYTGDADANFVSNARIVESILERERADEDGLNGFVILMHVGAGPSRSEPLHRHLGGLLDDLGRRGYRFVGVDDLLRTR